jgi:hypothetical protein
VSGWLIAKFVAIALLCWLCYHFGAQSVQVKDLKVEVKQQASDATQTTAEIKTVQGEAKTYADAVAKASSEPDLAPAVVCMRRYTLVQSAPGPAGAGDHGGGGLPAGAARAVPAAAEAAPVTDIGKPALEIGARANAQVAALKDYIGRVCLAPPPK